MPDLDIDADASLNISLGKVTDALNGLSKRLDREAMQRLRMPRQLPMLRQSLNNAATFDVLSFDGPQNGRMWEVRIIGVFNLSAAGAYTPLATTITSVYTGQRMPGPANGVLPVDFLRWQFTSIPGFEDFGGNRLRLQAGEDLIIGLTGIPAPPTNIYVSAVIDDIPAYAAMPVVGT